MLRACSTSVPPLGHRLSSRAVRAPVEWCAARLAGLCRSAPSSQLRLGRLMRPSTRSAAIMRMPTALQFEPPDCSTGTSRCWRVSSRSASMMGGRVRSAIHPMAARREAGVSPA
eukprot:scaffold21180_cov31-Tisochrysis_lutea.AAC.9